MRVRLLIVGWDGAEPSLVESLCASGRLSNLAALKQRGIYRRIASTVPASSLPAWTSAFTGLGPGKHGMTDFVCRDFSGYRLQLVGSEMRRAQTLFSLASRAGLRVASLGVPGNYPPEPVNGVCIGGFDSPVATQAAPQAYFPPWLHREFKARGLGWPYSEMNQVAVGPGWHRRARRALIEAVERKARATEAVLERGPFDLCVVVFSESDTAGHHFWAFHDRKSPRYQNRPELADTIGEVYHALDQALGRLLDAAGKGTTVMVLSDHGTGGASDRVCYLNRFLATEGLLRFRGISSLLGRSAGVARAAAVRCLPASFKQALLRGRAANLVMKIDGLSRFGGLDLQSCKAFSDELPQNPGIWIHLRGRDPQGTVDPGAEYQELCRRIAERLVSFRDPESGQPVVARVLRREEAQPGAFAGHSPDLLLELASWDGFRILAAPSAGRPGALVRRLAAGEWVGSKGIGTSGVHLPEGILVAAGPTVLAGAGPPSPRLVDIFPTAASLLGLGVPAELDGRPIPGIGPPAPTKGSRDLRPPGAPESGYTPEGEEALRKRLEGLDYP